MSDREVPNSLCNAAEPTSASELNDSASTRVGGGNMNRTSSRVLELTEALQDAPAIDGVNLVPMCT